MKRTALQTVPNQPHCHVLLAGFTLQAFNSPHMSLFPTSIQSDWNKPLKHILYGKYEASLPRMNKKG